MSLKICLISDSHNQHKKIVLPEADAIIHAGDISGMGREHEVIEFLNWFSTIGNFQHRIMISGNHDWLFQLNKTLAKEILSKYPNVIYLEDSEVTINGLRIYGTPWQPTFFNWAFNVNRGEEIKKYWDMIPSNGIDILVTHGPPADILDLCDHGGRVGCEDLLNRIKEIKPLANLFGHIHHSHGIVEKDGTLFINASVLNDDYRMVFKPHLIEIKDDKTIEILS